MKLSRKAYDYINNSLNYDIEVVMEKLIENIEELKLDRGHTVSLDECAIHWDCDYVMDADDFVKQVFKQAVEMVINVVEGFEEEEENV